MMENCVNNTPAIRTSVRAQRIVSNKSVLDDVIDFLQDVIPPLYQNQSAKTEEKEAIKWVKIQTFETAGDDQQDSTDIYIILGLSYGIQIWYIDLKGEANEILSIRNGPIKCAKILSDPEGIFGGGDSFAEKRPLLALCDNSASHPFATVQFQSLKTGEIVDKQKYSACIQDLICNTRVICVVLQNLIVVLDSCTLKERFRVGGKFPRFTDINNPVALGQRWLAYAETKLHEVYVSNGGVGDPGPSSYAASVLNAAKSISQGISSISEAVSSSLSTPRKSSKHELTKKDVSDDGVVTIIDMKEAGEGELSLEKGNIRQDSIIAHFLAHEDSPVAALSFSPCGSLLLTASENGHRFNVFRICSHPNGSVLCTVKHLYVLYRGDTSAKIQGVTFSPDSRWVVVSSFRGTCHVFPILPYGGAINARTHLSPHVVNRYSKFEKSAGLEEIQVDLIPSQSLDAIRPRLSSSASASSDIKSQSSPIVVEALAQIKNSNILAQLPASINGGSNAASKKNQLQTSEIVCLATCFSQQRITPQLNSAVQDRQGVTYCDGFYVMTSHGNLVEYLLHPYPTTVNKHSQVPRDSPIALGLQAYVQWNLERRKDSKDFCPPVNPLSPIMLIGNVQRKRLSSSNSIGRPEIGRTVNHLNDKDLILQLNNSKTEDWMTQVEISTHNGPTRRIWMGPQISMCTYQNLEESKEAEPNALELHLAGLKNGTVRSQPVCISKNSVRNRISSGNITIEAGSGSSFERGSNHEMDSASVSSSDGVDVRYGRSHGKRFSNVDDIVENIADAMADVFVSNCDSVDSSIGGRALNDEEIEEIIVPVKTKSIDTVNQQSVSNSTE